MPESRVTWFTSVPNLVFLGLSVLDLGPMYMTDRCQTDRRQTVSSLNAPALTTLSTFFDSVRWIHLAFVKMCPGLLGTGHNNKTKLKTAAYKTKTTGSEQRHLANLVSKWTPLLITVVMFQAQNREIINCAWKVAVSFKIITTTSLTRLCFITQHQTCKTKTIFWSQTGLVLRPTVSDHITGNQRLSRF